MVDGAPHPKHQGLGIFGGEGQPCRSDRFSDTRRSETFEEGAGVAGEACAGGWQLVKIELSRGGCLVLVRIDLHDAVLAGEYAVTQMHHITHSHLFELAVSGLVHCRAPHCGHGSMGCFGKLGHIKNPMSDTKLPQTLKLLVLGEGTERFVTKLPILRNSSSNSKPPA